MKFAAAKWNPFRVTKLSEESVTWVIPLFESGEV